MPLRKLNFTTVKFKKLGVMLPKEATPKPKSIQIKMFIFYSFKNKQKTHQKN